MEKYHRGPCKFLEEEAKCYGAPAGEQEATLGAISSLVPPCAQQLPSQGHI